jgi:hypothetical protein
VDEGGSEGGDAECYRGSGDEPAGTDPFADHVEGKFEGDVRLSGEINVRMFIQQIRGTTYDVEDGKQDVVVIASKTKIFLETSQSSIANIGTINEAHQVQDSD